MHWLNDTIEFENEQRKRLNKYKIYIKKLFFNRMFYSKTFFSILMQETIKYIFMPNKLLP